MHPVNLELNTGQVSDYTSWYHIAESCVFNKQSLPPSMCRLPNQNIGDHPSSRSYGAISPHSFDMFLSSTLIYSTCSPAFVWGQYDKVAKILGVQFMHGSFSCVWQSPGKPTC
ncbi:uncharacterized protein LOC126632300 [Malus sylvestris]|uniref:uncharacterized protein LOC126632300 n=1 Tax=Malus sylvestris TaxID=3752 RepID=UPI0021AD432A|nr:uncharacterized protein LOC126632300 [Malus sylvestris]